MGNSDSHAAFADGVRKLVDEDVDESDTAFWSSIFTAALSVEDIFEVISPTAVRNLRKRPRNLQLILRKMASTMASVCATADEGQLTAQSSAAAAALTTVRLLTRMAPFLHEVDDSSVHEILWRPGGLSEGDGSVLPGTPSPREASRPSSEARCPPSCGSELLHYLGRLLFLPGFTISPRTKMTGKHRGEIPKHRVDERVVWSGGVGISDKLTAMPAAAFMKARTEVLGCLLACLSGPLFQNAEEYKESPPQWLSHFVSGEVAHTANLFCSLMSTVCCYDPVGRGLPYGSYFSPSLEEDMVDKALQILCVALDFQPKEDEDKDGTPLEATWFLVDNSQLKAQSYGLGYRSSKDLDDLVPSKAAVWGEKVPGLDRGDGWIQVGDFYLPEELEGKRVLVPQDGEDPMQSMRKPGNVYRYMLQHVSKENEIDLIFTGLLRLLSSVHQAERTYLPHSMRSVGFYQEALVLLWHLLTLNPSFTKRVVDRHDSTQFLLSLIFLLQQAQKSIHLVGLLHTASFVLLVLSAERAFAVRLNEPYVAKRLVPLEIPSFNGNHADVLALALYKVISESLAKPQNDALVEMLLTALCNVSPYVKSFCLESCLKLVSLAERLSRPHYIFRTAFTHHGLVFLVELLNNLVQYQYEGNTMMVYAILRQAEVVNKLDRLSLADFKRPVQDAEEAAKRWEPTEEWMQSVKKKLPLQTLQCLIEYLTPQLEELCVEKEITDQNEVQRFLKATTLVGILPVPHPIVIRTYQASAYTAMWFTSYMWGVIFTRSQRMPLYDWKKIRLVTINN